MNQRSGSPWRRAYSVAELNALSPGTMLEVLGIEVTEVGAAHLCARMPVDDRTVQPYRLLHGGASVALAESLGSIGSTMTIDTTTTQAVGQSITANHLRTVRSGFVTGTARPVHLGRRSQVWDIGIVDEEGRPVCLSRLTLALLDRPSHGKPG